MKSQRSLCQTLRFLVFTQASSSGEQHVGGGVQRGFRRVLQHADDETDRDHRMAISLGMPNRLHASGISSSEPPATPEAPQAQIAATTLSRIAVAMSTAMPNVCTAARLITVMVRPPPAMLMVAPSGIDTEYVSSCSPRRLLNSRLTGIFAAELRVKNAVMPLSRKHISTSGYGLRRNFQNTMAGFITSATNNMQPSSTANRCR